MYLILGRDIFCILLSGLELLPHFWGIKKNWWLEILRVRGEWYTLHTLLFQFMVFDSSQNFMANLAHPVVGSHVGNHWIDIETKHFLKLLKLHSRKQRFYLSLIWIFSTQTIPVSIDKLQYATILPPWPVFMGDSSSVAVFEEGVADSGLITYLWLCFAVLAHSRFWLILENVYY